MLDDTQVYWDAIKQLQDELPELLGTEAEALQTALANLDEKGLTQDAFVDEAIDLIKVYPVAKKRLRVLIDDDRPRRPKPPPEKENGPSPV